MQEDSNLDPWPNFEDIADKFKRGNYPAPMRKYIATFLTVVFLVSLGLPANAFVKPGTSCKKLGQTSIYSGKKYTCIKSGNKLVWDKGKLPNQTNAKVTRETYAPKLGKVQIELVNPVSMPSSSSWPNLTNSTAFRIKLPGLIGYLEYFSDLKLAISSDYACWQYSNLFPSNGKPISYLGFARGKQNELIYIQNREPDFYCEIVKPASIEFIIVWKPSFMENQSEVLIETTGQISLI